MLHLRILKIGKTAKEYESLEQKFYTFLLPNKLEIVSLKPSQKNDVTAKQAQECQILKEKLLSYWPTILLTESGEELNSEQFAEFLAEVTSQTGRLQIVIGGAFGFSKEFKSEFTNRLALSKLTMPHDLAYIVLLEQLYRAITIQKGKSYHY